ncbi:MAG TPA: DNA primase [Planctomycetaceae bacterium]|nr:DNA primase [Planctomycetaceae bacterium]
MSTPLANDFKELVRARTDIAGLIGETVALQAQRGGREFVGLCPFHDDHNPSMRVYADRQSFRCWSCQAGGDCFEFVMKRDRVEFREALETLATRANLEMPAAQRNAGPNRSVKQKQYEIVAWAEQQFHDCLLKSPQAQVARDYLASRGFTAETIARFRLGFHPPEWEWLINRAQGKYFPRDLVDVQLASERDTTRGRAGYFDFFVGRVMFPIRDGQGRPVAFGGRVLPGSDDKGGKYLNSRDWPLFPKSQLLYALSEARDAISKTGVAVVTEGYTDCILAHQCGLNNFVATLGTALGDDHVSLLKRFARQVILVYDGDTAGRNATEKALVRFLSQEVDLRILTLPGELDPADFLLAEGADAFRQLLAGSVEVWEYKFNCVIARHGVNSIDSRHRVLEEMLETIAHSPIFGGATLTGASHVRQDILLGRLSQRLGLPEESVRKRLNELRRQQQQRRVETKGPAARSPQSPPPSESLQRLIRKPTKDQQTDCELLEILFLNPETVDSIRAQVQPDDIAHPLLRQLFEWACQSEAGESPFDRVMLICEDAQLKQLAIYLDEQARDKRIGPDALACVLECIQHRRELGTQEYRPRTAVTAAESARGNSKDQLLQVMEMNRKRLEGMQRQKDAALRKKS